MLRTTTTGTMKTTTSIMMKRLIPSHYNQLLATPIAKSILSTTNYNNNTTQTTITRQFSASTRQYSATTMFQGARNFFLSFNNNNQVATEEYSPAEHNPYMTYPLLTREQLKSISSNDKFKFEFGFASFGYHSTSGLPSVNSLSDLTDPTDLNSLLPRRRPVGSPQDTLSIKAGDDTMLVSPTVLAVADGVSGWESDEKHTSSGIWSRAMLETFSRLMTEYKLKHLPYHLKQRDIHQILDDSYLHTSHLMDLQHLSGLSTLVLGMLSGDLLMMVSIGDSKIYIIRNGELIKTNPTQMMSELCPQQIGTQTLKVLPSEIAWVDSIKLQQDDIIVMCSDGISDNLFESELIKYLNEFLNNKKNYNMKRIAGSLLIKAKEVAFDDYSYTPYNEMVNNLPIEKFGKHNEVGGKVDDMSIVVAKVVAK